jgi:hypothetical protein
VSDWRSIDASAGCPECNDEVQPGHFACLRSSAELLAMECAGTARRSYSGTWRWEVNTELRSLRDTPQRDPSPAVAARTPSPAERLVGELRDSLIEWAWTPSGLRPREVSELVDRAATFIDHAPALAVPLRRLSRRHTRTEYGPGGNYASIYETCQHCRAKRCVDAGVSEDLLHADGCAVGIAGRALAAYDADCAANASTGKGETT